MEKIEALAAEAEQASQVELREVAPLRQRAEAAGALSATLRKLVAVFLQRRPELVAELLKEGNTAEQVMNMTLGIACDAIGLQRDSWLEQGAAAMARGLTLQEQAEKLRALLAQPAPPEEPLAVADDVEEMLKRAEAELARDHDVGCTYRAGGDCDRGCFDDDRPSKSAETTPVNGEPAPLPT